MFNLLSPDDTIIDATGLPAVADGLQNSGDVTIIRENISDGSTGTAQTIARMQKLVSRGKRDWRIRKMLGRILNGGISGIAACAPKDYRCYAQACYQFCRDQIKYVYDPSMVEYIEDPSLLLESRIADCDSIVTLLCALWEFAGFDAQFITIKADTERPDDFSHVYARVKVPNVGWINADPTMPKQSFGWEAGAPGQYPKQYWPASTDDLEMPLDTSDSVQMSGMGCGGDCGCKGCGGSSSDNNVHGLGRLGAQMILTGPRARMVSNSGKTLKFKPPQYKARATLPPIRSHFHPVAPVVLHETSIRPTMQGVRGGGIGYLADCMSNNTMEGLGSTAMDASTLTVLQQIFDGSMYYKLSEARSDAFDDQSEIYAALNSSNPLAATLARQAQVANTKNLQAIQGAITKYSQIVNYIQTALGAVGQASLAPRQLSGLGVFGADDLVAAIVAAGLLVAVTAAIYALSDFWAVASGAKRDTDGLLDQLRNVIKAAGDAADQGSNAVLKVGVVAALGFVGYMVFKAKFAKGH